jgi:hypothetical protein
VVQVEVDAALIPDAAAAIVACPVSPRNLKHSISARAYVPVAASVAVTGAVAVCVVSCRVLCRAFPVLTLRCVHVCACRLLVSWSATAAVAELDAAYRAAYPGSDAFDPIAPAAPAAVADAKP